MATRRDCEVPPSLSLQRDDNERDARRLSPTGITRRGILRGVGAAALATAFGGVAPASEARAASAPDDPTFKLGLVTYMVGAKWDVPTLLDVCKKTGIAAVELRTTHAHGVEPAIDKARRAEVRKRFEDAGVVLWGLGSTCEFHSPDPAKVQQNIETCKQFVQLAADVGARGVKVRPNGLRKDVPAAQTLEQIGKALVPCGQAAAGVGVEVWVEVHGGETAKPANMKQIMEHCGHEAVGVTWNSNPEDVKDGSVAESFAMLRPWVKSCHINDLWRDMAGSYPYRELFRLMRGANYDRYTLIEVPRTPVDPAAGEDFLRYYKALWSELARG